MTETDKESENFVEVNKKPDSRVRAIIAMTITGPVGTMASVSFKYAATYGVKPIEFQIFRGAFQCLVSLVIMFFSGQHLWRDIPKGKFWLVLARAACGFTAFMLWMIALAQSPLSLNMVIANLMPFWSSLLALWLYGETIFCIEIVGMGICLGAVAGMALGANTDITEGKTGNTYDQVWIGVLLVLVVSWVSAFMAVIGRLGRNIHWSIFLFWYGLLGSTLPFIGLLIQTAFTHAPIYNFTDYAKAFGWMSIGALGDLGFIIAHITAYQSDATGFVSLLSYTGCIWGFLADFILFKMSFTVIQLVCAIIILVTVVYIALYNLKLKNAKN